MYSQYYMAYTTKCSPDLYTKVNSWSLWVNKCAVLTKQNQDQIYAFYQKKYCTHICSIIASISNY